MLNKSIIDKSILDKCIQNGCEKRVLLLFQTRMELLPLQQTKSFLEILKMERHPEWKDSAQNNLNQWLVWLKVLVEELPDHEQIENWKSSIALIENEKC